MRLFWVSVLLVCSCVGTSAQNPATVPQPSQSPASANPTAAAPTLPMTSQLKKAVVFLQTTCLHDFQPEVEKLTPKAQADLSPTQLQDLTNNLLVDLARLRQIKASIAKLTPDEAAMLEPGALPALQPIQMLKLVAKMADLTSDEIAGLSLIERTQILPVDTSWGTGFAVFVPDDRIPVPPGTPPANAGFTYLVTNHHVAQPGIENGKPCKSTDAFVLVNQKVGGTDSATPLRFWDQVKWYFPTDDSVDLAILPFNLSGDYDYIRIPISTFATQDMETRKEFVEGDPVLFCGLFIQTFLAQHRLEPIVRSGTLAMIPDGPMETTLHKPGRIFLAEAHAFGGNSGSPVFIDTAKFSNGFGFAYKFLGVISGEVFEKADLTLQVSSTYAGAVTANSGVSIVVPADQIKDLLYSPDMQKSRDEVIATQFHGRTPQAK